MLFTSEALTMPWAANQTQATIALALRDRPFLFQSQPHETMTTNVTVFRKTNEGVASERVLQDSDSRQLFIKSEPKVRGTSLEQLMQGLLTITVRNDEQVRTFVKVAWLGMGGYGSVWRVRDLSDNREYALKEMLQSHTSSGAYAMEVKPLLLVSQMFPECNAHLACLRFFGTDEVRGNHVIVTDLLRGQDLYAWLTDQKHVSWRAYWRVLRQLPIPIKVLHDELQMVHLDIKPENFVFATEDTDDDPQRLALVAVDFGFACRPPAEAEADNDGGGGGAERCTNEHYLGVGSLPYMSPESVEVRRLREKIHKLQRDGQKLNSINNSIAIARMTERLRQRHADLVRQLREVRVSWKPIDMFALGVIIKAMLTTKALQSSRNAVIDQILVQTSKSLLLDIEQNLLVEEPERRWTISQLMRSIDDYYTDLNAKVEAEGKGEREGGAPSQRRSRRRRLSAPATGPVKMAMATTTGGDAF